MRDYLDFRIEISGLREDSFFVQASCRLGETRQVIQMRYQPEFIQRVVSRLDDQSLDPRTFLELATELGNMLFPGEVAELLQRVFPTDTAKDGIRLRLVIRDQPLHGVPWEYAYLPLPDAAAPLSPYLALHPAVSIIRHQARPIPQPSVTTPTRGCRVLAVSALDLPGLERLSAAEATIIARALHETEHDGMDGLSFDLITLDDPVTPQALEAALEEEFAIFQFSGHSTSRTLLDGSVQTGFAIGDGRGGRRMLQPATLAPMLAEASVQVVVLNTCRPPNTEGADRLALAAGLVDQGIPAVVAMQFPVEDSHALAFSKGFYSALAAGLSLDEAVSLGRRRMQELGVVANWGAPVTFSRSADGRIFVSQGLDQSIGQDAAKPARMIAYRAGRDVPPDGPVEPAIRQAITAFCANWTPPERRDERGEIGAAALLESEPQRAASRGTNRGRPPVQTQAHDLFRLLETAYPEPVSEDELIRLLSLPGRRQLSSLAKRVNAMLDRLQERSLSQFSVESVGPAPGEQPPSRGYRLKRLPIARLLDRSPEAHGPIDYHLKHALSFYDVGRYTDCVHVMAGMFDTLRHQPGGLTVPEHALFFYYLSKALLKLNWYEELQLVLEGPYLRLSQSVLQDLEIERLHVAGIRFRQMGNLTAAQACFDDAVNTLVELLGNTDEPVLLRSLGDSHVLQAQCRLHHAVSSRQPPLARAAALRTAQESMGLARQYFQRLRQVTQTGTHYEGRLYGTDAFLGVATSLVQPETMRAEDWPKLERLARSGFEPERDRKPFGVLAGKFALAVVLLAKARWHTMEPQGQGDPLARVALEDANRLLHSVFEDYLEPGRVQLGATFEMPKVRLLAATVEELRRQGDSDRDAWRTACALDAIWSPLA